jgi:hypothetical protein
MVGIGGVIAEAIADAVPTGADQRVDASEMIDGLSTRAAR